MAAAEFNFGEEDLEGMARLGNEAVLCTEILADLLTPLAAFLCVADMDAQSFLLESVEAGVSLARYSFLGSGAGRVYRIRHGRLSVQEGRSTPRCLDGPPLQALRRARGGRVPVPQEGLPPFTGGLVGFFSYDFVRLLERIPPGAVDDLQVPQAVLAEYATVLAFDHLRNRLILMAVVDLAGDPATRKNDYRRARRCLSALVDRLAMPAAPPAPLSWRSDHEPAMVGEPDEECFQRWVVEAQEAITSGEIFQVVLSRRFSRPWRGSPIPVYRWLRSHNPSPYHFLLACDGDYVVGASPEMLVRVQGNAVQVRPIAGTSPRGRHAGEDEVLARELLTDEKERAEHVMLVDLARNDLGRVCRPGTIRVNSFAAVERYSHVMHLVSRVCGELAAGRDALDAFAACFPAGTLSGAPKVRAMEIIAEKEPFWRGPYGGAIAYWDRRGQLDSCIAIRTVLFTGGRAYVQAGAGIVADSDPAAELREISCKAAAGLDALARAAGGSS
jgi:anthranilate synthase component 1